jgi:hypothetical protein
MTFPEGLQPCAGGRAAADNRIQNEQPHGANLLAEIKKFNVPEGVVAQATDSFQFFNFNLAYILDLKHTYPPQGRQNAMPWSSRRGWRSLHREWRFLHIGHSSKAVL